MLVNILIKLKIISLNSLKEIINYVFTKELFNNIISYKKTKEEKYLTNIQEIYNIINEINYKNFEENIFNKLYTILFDNNSKSFTMYKDFLQNSKNIEDITSLANKEDYLNIRKIYIELSDDLSKNIKKDVSTYFINERKNNG